MFEKEICRKIKKVKIIWYPKEKICLVIYKKLRRIYKGIPRKYKILFKEKEVK